MAWLDPILSPIRGNPPVVAVVRLDGIIKSADRFSRGLSLARLAGPLEAAFKTKPARAVCLLINSPGGSAVQSDMIATRVRSLAKEHDKPVVAFVEDVAGSGGYWLALAADEIFVNPSSIVGSIGVIAAGFGFQDAIGRIGIERRVHTAGTRKALLDPFRPEDPEDVAHLRRIQDEIHGRFRAWVEERRGAALKPEEDPELFEGKFWTGERAVALGLADGTGDLRSVMRDRFGDKTRFRLYGERRSLMQRLGFARAGGTPTGAVPTGLGAAIADELLETVEGRALWARFGL